MTCCASVTISVFVRVLNLILAVPFLTRSNVVCAWYKITDYPISSLFPLNRSEM